MSVTHRHDHATRQDQPACRTRRTGVLRRPGGLSGAPQPDPISNSAVKRASAHGTVSQGTGESVAARPAQHTRATTFPLTILSARPTAGRTPGAGWSSPVARQAHNLKVTGSNPVPATTSHTTQRETAHSGPPGIARRGVGVRNQAQPPNAQSRRTHTTPRRRDRAGSEPQRSRSISHNA